jgi:3-phenylpropionate/trans-cinnamate dioxygenase ferredoxin subunit
LSEFIEAASTGEFRDGLKKKVLVGGQEILLARVGDNYYAVGNRCTHMGGELAVGQLEGTVVTCPLHGSQFDITDGHSVRWLKGSGLLTKVGKIFKSPRGLTVYRVKIEGDTILIEV